MNAWLSRLGKVSLRAAGYYARRLRADRFPGVAVLCYHAVRQARDQPMAFANLHVTASELDGHCRVIREHCHPISLDEWRSAIAGVTRLPPRPVFVTFDDGYRSVATLGLPILRKYEIPAAVFVCSRPVRDRTMTWYDAIALRDGEDRAAAMKRLPYQEWSRQCREVCRVVPEGDPHELLTVTDIQRLAAVPGIEIGGHTASHPILAHASQAEQRDEINSNKSDLEAWTGRPVRAFAYPNGGEGDFLPETVDLLHGLGFDAGFTLRYGYASGDESALERSRFLLLAGVTEAELLHRLCQSWPRPAAREAS